ncbi:regulator of microtubule dynamics protein 1 [Cyanistes caeruleus]|uniref:regulator of microtubule dynamics protein 1 n=1 Tax=Cyanistes caeruleus TaxID=156563 RepID=UPI000CDB3933|nr:regulator of microtubule dynamics protein 1 [Cyanistes caeruleus]
MQHHGLGKDWLKICPVEKDLGVLSTLAGQQLAEHEPVCVQTAKKAKGSGSKDRHTAIMLVPGTISEERKQPPTQLAAQKEEHVVFRNDADSRQPPLPEVLRKSLQRGVVLSTGSLLVYEAHKLISGFAEVHASFKVEDVIEQADYLYGSGETEKLYRLLVQHKNSDDAELLWRLARSSRDLAQLGSTSAEEKKQLTYDSLEYAKKALEKNESNSAAHKWYGICLSDVGDYEGIKTKIGNAIIIKEHFQRAIELNPKDATTIHLIGIWCYSFAEMPWYQRKIAATLFATPPTSTFQEALRYFHMAEEADPNFYSKNLLFLGKTYLKLNNKKMALLWLSKAKEYPAQTEEDKQVQKEALELLNSI